MRPMAGSLSKLGRQGRDVPFPAGRRMGLLISLALAVLCLGIALSVGAPPASARRQPLSSLQEEICGELSDSSTWTTAQSPFNVTCDTTLLPGVTLEIEPGVEIRFTAGVSLTIAGTLRAIGTPARPIVFSSASEPPAPGDWNGLHFVGGSSGSILAWSIVEYATAGVHVKADPGKLVSPALVDCVVRQHSEHGIVIEGEASGCDKGLARPIITGCLVEDNGGCGIHGHGHGEPFNTCVPFTSGSVGGTVSGNEIRDNQGPGICLRSELDHYGHGDVWIRIEANVISGNAGHGVHLYGDDPVHPHIENNLLYGNGGAGLQSDAQHEETDLFVVNNSVVGNGGDGITFNRSASQVYLANNILVDNDGYGLVCYGSGYPQAFNNDIWRNAWGGYSGCTPGTSDISADPLLLDPASGDLHLSFGSPCIDAGTSTGAPDVDFEGTARPQGDGVDIGAHELWYHQIYLPLILSG